MKPLDGEPVDGRPRRRPAAEAGRLDGRCRTTRSSPGPWPTATGRTSSAAASSIRWTTCASPTRRPTPSCSTRWPRTWSDNKYSLKHLVKTIVKSRTYQLSSTPNEFNKHDKQNYARYYPRRMSAEVLFDAVNQVTDSPATFGGSADGPLRSEAGDHAAGRVVPVVLPGRVRPAAAHQRVRMRAGQRGQPGPGAAPAELGRDPEQAGASGRPGRELAKDPRPDAEKVDELFLWALGRKPTPEQRDLALANIAKNAANKKVAYENILWALLEHQGVRVQQVRSADSTITPAGALAQAPRPASFNSTLDQFPAAGYTFRVAPRRFRRRRSLSRCAHDCTSFARGSWSNRRPRGSGMRTLSRRGGC